MVVPDKRAHSAEQMLHIYNWNPIVFYFPSFLFPDPLRSQRVTARPRRTYPGELAAATDDRTSVR
jgi:hypothetical protein